MKEAKLFSILVDEVENHKVEQFPICTRLVDKNKNIWEEFLELGRWAAMWQGYCNRDYKGIRKVKFRYK